MRVQKAGPNKGKPFYVCGASFREASRCGTFFGFVEKFLDPSYFPPDEGVGGHSPAARQRNFGPTRRRSNAVSRRIQSEEVDVGMAMDNYDTASGRTFT